MNYLKKGSHLLGIVFTCLLFMTSAAIAGETYLKLPEEVQSNSLLMIGLVICVLGMFFGFYGFLHLKKLPAHKSMLDLTELIFQTAKTYLIQQGKFLVILFLLIAACIAFYFGVLRSFSLSPVIMILFWSVIGILGSYGVAWFGIRVDTLANSRMAFAGGISRQVWTLFLGKYIITTK